MNNIDKIMGKDYVACHFPFLWLYGGESVENVVRAVVRAKEMGCDGLTIEPRDFRGLNSENCNEWFTLLSAIIEKAHELELKIIIVDEDSKCPTGHAFGAVCKPEYEHLRRKSVVESHVDVIGPCEIDLVVGKPKVYNGEPWEREPVKDEIIGCYLYPRIDKNNGIDTSNPIDLTGNIKDGILSCSIPKGNYRIMYFYAGARFSNMYNDDFIDMLDSESVDLLIHGVYDMYERRYKKYFGNTIVGFFSDEPFIGNGYAYCRTGYGRNQDTRIGHIGITFPYNKNIKERLDAIYGENSLKYFPSLWYWDEKISPEFRKNYMNVISTLYKECFSTRIGDWCRKRGLMYIGHVLEDNNLHSRIGNGPGHYFRSQQGQSMAGMDIVMHQIMPGFADINLGGYGADLYNTEFYHYILAKLASSATHTYNEFNGKAMCELTIGYGWAEGTQLVKWLFDYLFVRGINFFVPGCSVATFPDNIHAPHFGAYGGVEPQQQGFKNVLDYSKKIATVFDGSEHICNALILYHAQAEWMSDNDYMLMERPAKILYDSHIDFDILSDDLLDKIKVVNQKMQIKESYDCLVVPYAKYLPSDLMERLYKLKTQNADIVFVDELPENCYYKFNVVALNKLAEYFVKNKYFDIKVDEFHLLRHYHTIKENTHYYLFFNESVNQVFNGEVYTGKYGNYNVYNFALNNHYAGNGDKVRFVKDLEYNLQLNGNKYYGAGETFLSYRAARSRMQELRDEIYENAMDLVYTLCPVQNRDQPNWEEGARNLIFGLVLAFCEDCIKGRMEEKQLLLFNVYHNIMKYCSEDTTTLKQYLLEGRDEFSKVRGLVNAVLITSDKTLTSYLSEVISYMQQLSDDGILSLTSENDLDIINMDENPNAVFVIVPDERFTRHRFVTLFITQMYKELVEKANLNLRREHTETAILKRNTYFVLDEFGNLPKFENAEGMVTVARSRGIRFLFVLQSFSQLTAKYGREVGDIIKTNCNVKIFIGSDDSETRKEFSELCGQKKIKNFSVNTNAETSASSNTGASNQPLITVGMLERLNGNDKGDAIVSVRGYEPIWTVFTPSYELKGIYFKDGKASIGKREAVFFDKSEYVYDIHGEEESKVLEAIEKREREESKQEENRQKDLNTLDREWQSIADDIDLKLNKFAIMLKGKDSKVVKGLNLGSKATFLYAIMENYDKPRAKKIQEMADYISARLPKLKELQDKAGK